MSRVVLVVWDILHSEPPLMRHVQMLTDYSAREASSVGCRDRNTASHFRFDTFANPDPCWNNFTPLSSDRRLSKYEEKGIMTKTVVLYDWMRENK